MFSFRSLGFGIPTRLFSSGSRSNSGINFPSVTIHDVEENPDKRARTVKHLIKANHINYSVIYNNLRFHNHTPHVLGSAYILGATSDQLKTLYDAESQHHEAWRDSPSEISKEDWRSYLGQRNYQRAYVDFFEDRLVAHGYDWKELLEEYLFSGPQPLANNLVSGLAHPIIHLAYAYELSSPTVAIEALALSTCFYDGLHKYLDEPSYTKPGPEPSADLLELLGRVAKDKRFDAATSFADSEDYVTLWQDTQREEALLGYWNSWDLSDPQKQFADSQKAAAALLVGSMDGSGRPRYDFYLLHALTSSHAIRILLPLFPAYIMERRPSVDLQRIHGYDLKGRGWDYVVDRALTSKQADDAHFVKGCRALKVAAETWGDEDQFFLKSAVRFAEEFSGWGF